MPPWDNSRLFNCFKPIRIQVSQHVTTASGRIEIIMWSVKAAIRKTLSGLFWPVCMVVFQYNSNSWRKPPYSYIQWSVEDTGWCMKLKRQYILCPNGPSCLSTAVEKVVHTPRPALESQVGNQKCNPKHLKMSFCWKRWNDHSKRSIGGLGHRGLGLSQFNILNDD